MSALGHKQTLITLAKYVRFAADSVAKLFEERLARNFLRSE